MSAFTSGRHQKEIQKFEFFNFLVFYLFCGVDRDPFTDIECVTCFKIAQRIREICGIKVLKRELK